MIYCQHHKVVSNTDGTIACCKGCCCVWTVRRDPETNAIKNTVMAGYLTCNSKNHDQEHWPVAMSTEAKRDKTVFTCTCGGKMSL